MHMYVCICILQRTQNGYLKYCTRTHLGEEYIYNLYTHMHRTYYNGNYTDICICKSKHLSYVLLNVTKVVDCITKVAKSGH